eukprot:414078_1
MSFRHFFRRIGSSFRFNTIIHPTIFLSTIRLSPVPPFTSTQNQANVDGVNNNYNHNHNHSPNHNVLNENDNDSDEEKAMELSATQSNLNPKDDILLNKAMEEFSGDGFMMIKLGKTPRDKERECYAGFIITEDTGKIFGNQLVFQVEKN